MSIEIGVALALLGLLAFAPTVVLIQVVLMLREIERLLREQAKR